MPIASAGQGFRTPASTAEQLVHAGPCIVYGISPDLTTTGTITIRDGAAADASGAVLSVSAIGLTQAGKQFGQAKGVLCQKGLTVQLSVATDLSLISWEAC